jgi:hypothetical protein
MRQNPCRRGGDLAPELILGAAFESFKKLFGGHERRERSSADVELDVFTLLAGGDHGV